MNKMLTKSLIPQRYMSLSDGSKGGGPYDSYRSKAYNYAKKKGNEYQVKNGMVRPILMYVHVTTGMRVIARPEGRRGNRFRMCILIEAFEAKRRQWDREYTEQSKVVPLRPVPTPTGPMTLTDAEARLFIAYLRDTANAIEARLG